MESNSFLELRLNIAHPFQVSTMIGYCRTNESRSLPTDNDGFDDLRRRCPRGAIGLESVQGDGDSTGLDQLSKVSYHTQTIGFEKRDLQNVGDRQ
jgi:hypothetical protein